MSELRDRVIREARGLGFADVRFAAVAHGLDPETALPAARFTAFVDAGRQASMGWLASSAGDRLDARRIFPSVRTVAVLRFDYGGPAPPSPGFGYGRVASYAWGRDYHNLLGRRLKKLQHRINDEIPTVRTYTSIDSRPVWERAWAEAAGLGYPARNGNILTPSQGAYYFIATLLIDTAVEPDAPIVARCGACTRCLPACPTRALPGDGSVDVPRCISYLTIEEPGPIPVHLRPALGSWVFGCDDCQEVCPHVGLDRPPVPPELRPHNAWLDLVRVLEADDDWLTAVTTGTPLRRAAPLRLKRNAAIVLGNQLSAHDEDADGPFADRARRVLRDAAAHPDPVLAESAAWALRDGPRAAFRITP